MNADQITIIMVTRNRPVSLENCLARTRAVIPPDIRILVFDDASTEGLRVRSIVESHSNIVYLSSPTLVGPGEGRNRCLQSASTPFCLSLDDDCYLDSIPDLSRWMANRPEDRDIAAVGFRYCNLPSGDLAPPSDVSGPAKGFHGGASLLRRDSVLKAGGYLDWLVFACEDTELAMRLGRLGYRVWYDPAVIVQHARSDEGREKRSGAFYYVRNTLLLNMIYGGNISGIPFGLLRALRRGVFHTDALGATLPAIVSGLALFSKCRHARKDLFSSDRSFFGKAAG